MTLFTNLLFAAQLLASSVAAVHTGFAYGAFWGVDHTCKKKADFVDAFKLARNLNTTIPFDSARLFTTIQCETAGTTNEPIEALEAAIETNTSILLGFWLSGAKDEYKEELADLASGTVPPTNAALLQNELVALDKAFQKHGQALADLVIGLSVGNEDLLTWDDKSQKFGASAETIKGNIETLRKSIAESPFAEYMRNKPIGHTDVPQQTFKIDNSDFVGMNAYPYWHPDPIENSKVSYQNSLRDIEQRVGDKPVWLTEIGWPYADNVTQYQDRGQANEANMQRYWTEVICEYIGKYTIFVFELQDDTDPKAGQPYWGIVDSKTRQPRLKDLNCPGSSSAPGNETAPGFASSRAETASPVASQGPSTSKTLPSVTTPSQLPTLVLSPPPSTPSVSLELATSSTSRQLPEGGVPTSAPLASTGALTSTVHTTITVTMPKGASTLAGFRWPKPSNATTPTKQTASSSQTSTPLISFFR